MIEFKNVSKKYDGAPSHALKDINLTIDKGEFVFVVGSSGAGKSTFLKLMMREEVPSTGSIVVDDIDLTKIKKRDIPKFRRRLGIVFQDFRLIPSMNVYDNIAYAMRVIGARETEIRKRVPYLLGLVGVAPVQWLTDGKISLISIAIMSIWKNAGYNMLILLAALQGIPESLYEASALDGITPWRKLINIKLPLIMPSMSFLHSAI